MKCVKRRRAWAVIGIVLIAVVFLWISATAPFPTSVTIANDTTYITEPLGEDGLVDFVAALNRLSSQGVTPENNSAVLFWTAMGPSAIDAKYRDTYFRTLGMPSLAEQGDYFVTRETYARKLTDEQQQADLQPGKDADLATSRRLEQAPQQPLTEQELQPLGGFLAANLQPDDATSRQLDQASKRAWTETEFPVLAKWLAANEKPLNLLLEASKRPRRYDPMISEDGTVIGIQMPAIVQTRNAAEALIARAMLRASDANFDLAWEDLLASHRLARLMSQGPTMVEALVADAVDLAVCAGDQGLLQSMPLTAAQASTMRADLAGLPTMPKVVDKVDNAERFIYLSAVLDIRRELTSATGGDSLGMAKMLGKGPGKFDWDFMLRMGNTWYDKTVAAGRQPSRAERIAAMQDVTDEWSELERKFDSRTKNGFTKVISSLLDSRHAASEAIGFTILAMIFPAIEAANNAQDRATMQLELVKLACALAEYRAEHGSFPVRLDELMPEYVTKIPQDLFSAAELHYARDGDGYVLYSVGANGKDEGGKGADDQADNAESWDDLAIRVPATGK